MLSYRLVFVSNRVMQDPLIIVHRSLGPYPAQRHTSPPHPKNPTAAPTPTPSSPPRDQESERRLPSFSWFPQQKAQSRRKPHRHHGTPEDRNNEKITPLHRIGSRQRFFKLFLKVRTDDASLISGGMPFQIFAPLKQMDRKPYCGVFNFFAR